MFFDVIIFIVLNMNKYVMPALAATTILINISAMVCVFVFPPEPYALFGLTFVPTIVLTYIQLMKRKFLLQKKQIQSMIMLGLLFVLSVFYLIMGLAMLIYLQELQNNNLKENHNFNELMWQRSSLSYTNQSFLSIGYYLGNCIFISIYTREYYRMFWVNHIIHIFRYLKSKSQHLNQTLLSHLRIISVTRQLRNEKCCLCIESYEYGEEVTKLNCGHIFHRNCIKLWVFRSNACPLCRKRVVFY